MLRKEFYGGIRAAMRKPAPSKSKQYNELSGKVKKRREAEKTAAAQTAEPAPAEENAKAPAESAEPAPAEDNAKAPTESVQPAPAENNAKAPAESVQPAPADENANKQNKANGSEA